MSEPNINSSIKDIRTFTEASGLKTTTNLMDALKSLESEVSSSAINSVDEAVEATVRYTQRVSALTAMFVGQLEARILKLEGK